MATASPSYLGTTHKTFEALYLERIRIWRNASFIFSSTKSYSNIIPQPVLQGKNVPFSGKIMMDNLHLLAFSQ